LKTNAVCKYMHNVQYAYDYHHVVKNVLPFLLTYKLYREQAFDSIAGNTVVPYRSLKKIFIYHKLLFIVIYNSTFR